MAWITSDPHQHLGQVVDNGQCMRHVQVVAGVAHSSTLRQGAHARTTTISRGTVIGTFDDDGCYANATDGSSHVAVFVQKQEDGLIVVDQWVGQPVHERLIRFKAGGGPACDDADRFHVVEAANDQS